MSARFTAASSQYLMSSSAPVTAMPFTVGMWVNLAAVGTAVRALWHSKAGGTSTNTNYYVLQMTTAETVQLGASDAAITSVATTGVLSAGKWSFVVARLISATNRRLDVLFDTGVTEHVQSTVSRSPAGIDTFVIGARLDTGLPASTLWDGMIGEYWISNIDIQGDGAALRDSTLLQLAYGGPFSVPHIVPSIVEYRSFRKFPTSDADDASEVYFGGAGSQVWSNVNGVTTGPHPPLPYWYVKPNQVQTELVI